MAENPNTCLVISMTELESLRKRIHELEAEKAKLSDKLANCICHKVVKSDETCILSRNHLIKERGRLILDDTDPKDVSEEKIPDKCSHTMTLANLPRRYVALKVMYFGQRFYGFASEAQMEPTVESELFKALRKTRLISGNKKELQYSRCGRTDKGVSSVGQVISLFLRSNVKETVESNGWSGGTSGGEMDYVKVLNRVLPSDIRVLGWSPAPTDFSARFSCLSRKYKYFFWRGNLNIVLMETAGKKLIGEHDFRNFCKMDAANVHNYRRNIMLFEVLPCNEKFENDQLWVMKVQGSAFLWHQIRCMVAVLFLIGHGLESPNVIDKLLDVKRTPRKPQYIMAPEIPLVLQSCEFEGLKFKCSSDARQALSSHLEKQYRDYKLEAAVFHEALLSSSSVSSEEDQLLRTKKKEPSHIPLMSRPTEHRDMNAYVSPFSDPAYGRDLLDMFGLVSYHGMESSHMGLIGCIFPNHSASFDERRAKLNAGSVMKK